MAMAPGFSLSSWWWRLKRGRRRESTFIVTRRTHGRRQKQMTVPLSSLSLRVNIRESTSLECLCLLTVDWALLLSWVKKKKLTRLCPWSTRGMTAAAAVLCLSCANNLTPLLSLKYHHHHCAPVPLNWVNSTLLKESKPIKSLVLIFLSFFFLFCTQVLLMFPDQWPRDKPTDSVRQSNWIALSEAHRRPSSSGPRYF